MILKNKLCIIFDIVALAVIACAPLNAKEPKTIITGEQMEIAGGGNTVIFSGGAKVSKGANVLTADRIVQDKKNDKVEANGKVKFTSINDDKETLRGASQKAFYDISKERGELFGGKPEISYYMKTSTSPVILRADRITFDTRKEELYGKGNVEIVTSSITAYAPSAVFVQKEKKIVLSGAGAQPMVVYYEGGKKNRYRADKITFLSGGDKVVLKGNVKAVMIVEDKEDGPKIRKKE